VSPSHRATVRLLFAAGLVAFLLAVGTAFVTGSHVDDDAYEAGEASNFTIHTYAGPDADQRRPGAADRSYWTESVVYEIPEGERVYLQESITYRPVPSDCSPGDTDEFGIDRDATYQGERKTDEDIMDSVKSFQLDQDVRQEYEDGPGEYGDLTTAEGWAYVERITIDWYGPDDFGSPVQLSRGDRFVTAQRACLDNPDAAGWYRWAGINTVELENGTTIRQERPTFSHWYWVCDCQNRSDAVETLGPPPSEQSAESDAETETGGPTPTPQPSAGTPSTAEPGETDGEETPAPENGTPTPEASGPSPATPADTPAPTDTPQPTPASSPTNEWEDQIYQTPTREEGAGLTPLTALFALLLVVGAFRYRR
jgi:hypothetical protein